MKNIAHKILALFMAMQIACGGMEPSMQMQNNNPWRVKYPSDTGSMAAYKVDLIGSEIEIPLNIQWNRYSVAQKTEFERAVRAGQYGVATELTFDCTYRTMNGQVGNVGYAGFHESRSDVDLHFGPDGRLYTSVRFILQNGKTWYDNWGADTTGELIACLTERTNQFGYTVRISTGTGQNQVSTIETGTSTIYFNGLRN